MENSKSCDTLDVKRDPLKNEKKYPSSKEILELLKTGAMIAIVLTSPCGGAELIKRFGFKLLDKIWDKYNKARLKESIKRMVNRKILEVKKIGNETMIVVSEKGKKLSLRYNFQDMQLAKPKVWDGKWRVVIFDVRESKRFCRDGLRNKIKQLGLYQLQKSVFVTPYPCDKEIAFLRQYFGIGNEVSYFTTDDLEEDNYLRSKFNLKRS